MTSRFGEHMPLLITAPSEASPQIQLKSDQVVINFENVSPKRVGKRRKRRNSVREEYSRTGQSTITHVYKIDLLQGVLDRSLDEYKDLSEKFPDLNLRDPDNGSTALHVAAIHDKEDIMEFLIESGADCNALDAKGQTPLHLAIQYGHDGCCEKLIRCEHLKISSHDQDSNTLLHIATREGRYSVCCKITERLNEQNALKDIINSKNKDGVTPLHFAAKVNNSHVLRLLLQNGADHKSVDKASYSPLHCMSEHGYVDCCKLLLSSLSEAEKRDALEAFTKSGHTPLMLAAKGGYRRCCETMKDGNLNCQDDKGKNTAMHFAVRNGYSNTVAQLLEIGANPNVKNKRGHTPLHESIKCNKLECLQILVQKGADVKEVTERRKNVLHLAAESRTKEAFEFLVENLGSKGLLLDSLRAKDKSSSTPLHLTIKNKYEDSAILLLEKGASPSEGAAEKVTPLHLAAAYGCVNVCEFLLSKNEVQVNQEDKKKTTALHMAAFDGSENICRLLIKRGANINAKDSKGMTPVHIASAKGFVQVVKLLVKKRAVLNEPNGNGSCPLHLAALEGSLECCKILIAHARDVNWRKDQSGHLPVDLSFKKKTHTSNKESLAKGDETFDYLVRNLRYKENQESLMLRIHGYMRQAIQQKRRIVIRAITESSWWPSGITGENGHQCQNFRFLIEHFSDVAALLMDNCISQDKGNSKIKVYDFRLFEDNYFVGEKSEQLSQSPFDPNTYRLLPDAVPYHNGLEWKVRHPLTIMAKHRRLDLLYHPLTEKWMSLKWEAHVRWIFFVLLSVEFFSGIVLGIFMSSGDTSKLHATVENHGTVECSSSWDDGVVGKFICWHLLLLFEVLTILLEFNSLCKLTPLEYIKYKEHFVQIAKIICIGILLIPWSTSEYTCATVNVWRWGAGILALLLTGLHLIFTLNQIPSLSVFMPITRAFISGFLLVWLYTAMILFIFAFIFHLLLKEQDPFSSVPQSMVKTIVWMIGDLAYDDTFLSEGHKLHYPWLTNILFVIFVTVLGGLLTNLIIHQPASKLDRFRENARFHKAVNRTDLMMNLEICFPFFTKDKTRVKHKDTGSSSISCGDFIPKGFRKLFTNTETGSFYDAPKTPDPIQLQLQEMNKHLSEIQELKIQLAKVIQSQIELQKSIKSPEGKSI